ncbi:GNAT family N-acetyltransferase [Vibrio sp. YIC-376]|uniref:GNAT family N-acetyltransferase n=1 Tax=Vibrio sp. YIC-376 TaxID=3136162 RepID=UPI00402AF1B0
MKTLTTERLTLRLVSVDDAPFILELYNQPDFYNHRSISLLKKLGFRFEQVHQRYDNGRTLELHFLNF